jgi:hypothetical protein
MLSSWFIECLVSEYTSSLITFINIIRNGHTLRCNQGKTLTPSPSTLPAWEGDPPSQYVSPPQYHAGECDHSIGPGPIAFLPVHSHRMYFYASVWIISPAQEGVTRKLEASCPVVLPPLLSGVPPPRRGRVDHQEAWDGCRGHGNHCHR